MRRSLHSGHAGQCRRKKRREYSLGSSRGVILGQIVLYNRSDNYSYTSSSTLKRPRIKKHEASQLDDGGVEKVRLERGLKGSFDIFLSDCLS